MADYFREAFEGLKESADALIRANTAIKRVADAVLAAKDEHEDLRETLHRLEALVMQQGLELRQQREELRRLRDDIARRNGGDPH